MKKTILLLCAAMMALVPMMAQSQQLPGDSLLRREVARMLLVGFTGNTINSQSDAARYVRDLHVGGIILFDLDLTGTKKLGSRNVTSKEQLTQLTSDLQSYADEPLIIAADQEGGLVCRLKTQYGFKPTVNALYLGTTDNRDTTMFYAQQIAQELSQCGVTLNLAPVLDVHLDNNPHLGHYKRCFSTDVDVITRHAAWMIDAHHSQGVLCAAKHFPGQGNATGDSHLELVDVTNQWTPQELEPYKRLIAQNKIDVVMTAHIYNHQLDPDYPATLSSKTIGGVLRDQLGFDGVVVSDDMYMEGILSQHSVPEAFALAINAGVDLLLVGNNIDTGFEANRPFQLVDMIVDLVKTGRVPYERIHQSSERIKRLKTKIGIKS